MQAFESKKGEIWAFSLFAVTVAATQAFSVTASAFRAADTLIAAFLGAVDGIACTA